MREPWDGGLREEAQFQGEGEGACERDPREGRGEKESKRDDLS
jgi:hypothetical protein